MVRSLRRGGAIAAACLAVTVVAAVASYQVNAHRARGHEATVWGVRDAEGEATPGIDRVHTRAFPHTGPPVIEDMARTPVRDGIHEIARLLSIQPPDPTPEAQASLATPAPTSVPTATAVAALALAPAPTSVPAIAATAPPAVVPAAAVAAGSPAVPTAAPAPSALGGGARQQVSLSFYYCESGGRPIGDGGGFCGRTADGTPVQAGVASCGPGLMGQQFVIEGDPTGQLYRCADTGGAVGVGHRDIWFRTAAEGSAWFAAVGNHGVIEVR